MFVTFLICALFSVAPLHNQYNVEDHNENNVVEIKERKNIVYDDSTYTVTYDSNDISDDYYNYWRGVMDDLKEAGFIYGHNLSVSGSIIVNDVTYSLGYIYANEYGYNLNFIDINHSNLGNIEATGGHVGTYTSNHGSITISSLTVISEVYYNISYSNYHTPTTGEAISVPLHEFVTILTAPIVGVATGVATGVSHMAESLFLASNQGTITGLSTFGGIMALFCGLGLAIHLTIRVYLWITSLGKD